MPSKKPQSENAVIHARFSRCKPPWGTQVDSKRLIPNADEIAIARQIVAWRVAGHGLRAICRLLNDAGIEPREVWHKSDGKWYPGKWMHHKVKQILNRCEKLEL